MTTRTIAALAAASLLAGCATAAKPAAAPAPIASSRLGMAKATGTVPAGMVQVEAGYSRARLDQRTRHTLGETLVRVGLDPRTELRFGLSSYLRTETPASTVQGFGDASVSLKHRVRDANGFAPAVALVAGTTLPVGEKAIGAGAFQPEGGVSAEWKIPHGLRAVGMATWRDAIDAGDRYGVTTLAAGGRTNVGRSAAVQLELGRVLSTRAGAADVTHLRVTGALRLTPSLQLDGWAGRATSAGKHEYLLGLGFARRW